VTGAVAAEAAVVRAAGIGDVVASNAGLIEAVTMSSNPIAVQMGLRFTGLLKRYHRPWVTGLYNFRNRMAEIAFQPNRGVVVAHMLAVVAAEATRKVLVPDVVWVSWPSDVHIREHAGAVAFLECADRGSDFVLVLGIIVRVVSLIPLPQLLKGLSCLILAYVGLNEQLGGSALDLRNAHINEAAR
jgi:hypothetical protein